MLAQPGWQLYILLFCFIVLLPVALVWGFALWRKLQLRLVLWSLVACSAGYLAGIWGLQQNQVLWSEQQLTLKAGFYQTAIADLSSAGSMIEVLPVSALGDYQPQAAVDGIRLPGYHVGWYMLRNRQMAFVMLIGDVSEVSLIKAGDKLALVSGDLLRQRSMKLAGI